MIACYILPAADVPGWSRVRFCSGLRALGRPAMIPTSETWRLSSSLYRLTLAYNVGAIADQRRPYSSPSPENA